MTDPVEHYLDRHGPALSSAVAGHLVEHLNITPAAARQRVSRARGADIRRLAGISFPHKARFLYLQREFGSPRYWERLTAALIETRSAYGFALAALRQRDGIVPARQFPIICGAPLRQAKHLAPETILARLTQAGLLIKVDLPGVGECIALAQTEEHYGWRGDRLRARMIAEDILLLAVKDWLKKLGIVSFDKVATRNQDPPPRVSTSLWDLSAPSYLGPLLRPGTGGQFKNGFVVADVYLGEAMTEHGVAPFIRKCTTLRGLRNVGACMQMMVADRYEGAAFQLLKQNGIVPATPANLFGEEVAAALRQLATVLENAAHSVIDPARFDELFRRLGQIEGAANQLRGTLFEYLAAELLRRTTSAEIKTNRIFKAPGKGQAEADVVAVLDPLSITLVECKGYSPRATIPNELFDRWLHHNVPTCFHAIKNHPDYRNLNIAFEFWATAPLSPEAAARFETAKAALKPERYSIKLRLNPELRAMCRATHDPSLITAFEKHFTKVERDEFP